MSEQLKLGADFAESKFDRFRELDARVESALRSPLLDEKDKKILRVIARHKGAALAIRAALVAEEAGMISGEVARRKICSTIETCRLLFKLPIGASRVQPYGYFLIVSSSDLELAIQPLAGELYALMRLMRALSSRHEVAKLFDQTKLKLEAEEPKEGA